MNENLEFQKLLQKKIDNKTKPLGSLGKIEEIAFQVSLIQKSLEPKIQKPLILVFAGDHGITEEGVSLYPKEVTYQMVFNFLQGGAAISVFCKTFGISLEIVDSGVDYEFPSDLLIHHLKVRRSTRNFLKEKAMTKEEMLLALERGKKLTEEKIQTGVDWLGFGEMGIGNTSASALLMSEFLGLPLELCIGKGTGHSLEGLDKKKNILQKAKNFHSLQNPTPEEILQTFGGYEIAMMAGAMLKAYEKNIILVVDGFISTAAFLYARTVCPKIMENTFFSHKSDEKGHGLMLEKIGAKPILDLQLRLGEGTGAALSYPIFQASISFLNEMASFEQANVSKI
jgi:nicotinate-nucleotide--dimethylbenzimidazole phosphoribosyltransferase